MNLNSEAYEQTDISIWWPKLGKMLHLNTGVGGEIRIASIAPITTPLRMIAEHVTVRARRDALPRCVVERRRLAVNEALS